MQYSISIVTLHFAETPCFLIVSIDQDEQLDLG